MSLRELQKLMREIYFERDEKRGISATYIWFISEVGELADALVKGKTEDIAEEAADVIAWLLSLCNLVNIDLEGAVYEKYGGGCPRCYTMPCRCEY
ncbi:nucleotide pyrophosphohydrolase [Candidatus Bathyarchaeota archaeon]|nr:nucleotide pyrophosphohydrolase [Candidatus Bathyarchaeota archaeon]MBS7613775.1 nucleotide pyrophosphohydrolase [Candidatus Bathyarchaeota archaeon]MBS7617204.1 nucleotide pyrophosphohydrolase [Candidatus Bathyarchaeota archaeon]